MRLRIVVLPDDVKAAEKEARHDNTIINARLCPVGRAFSRAFAGYREPKARWFISKGALVVEHGGFSATITPLPKELSAMVDAFDRKRPVPHVGEMFVVDVPAKAFK